MYFPFYHGEKNDGVELFADLGLRADPNLFKKRHEGGIPMVKLVSTLKRPPTMSLDEFHRWWLGPHAAMAKDYPGLKKYVISLAIGARDGEPKYDGIAELWFEGMDDLNKIYASPGFLEARKDVMERGISVVTIFTEEHAVL